MLPEHERSFSAESPVGRYWLLNCVGFRVERARRGVGIVETVGQGADGSDVLAVRGRGLFRQRVTMVRAERVASIHPWDDTIVLGPRSQLLRRRTAGAAAGPSVRTRAAALESRMRPHAQTAAAASARGAGAAVTWVRGAMVLVAALVARAAVLVVRRFRRHAPVVRRTVASGTKATLALAAAYATALWQLARETTRAVAANIEAARQARRERAVTQASEAPAPVAELHDHRAADWPLRKEGEIEHQDDTEKRPSRTG